MPSKRPKPFCRCGCGRRVRRHANRWASQACVPRSVRVEAAIKGRKAYAYRVRRVKFAAVIDRLSGRLLSREDLFDVLAKVDRSAYASGYNAGRNRRQVMLSDVA